MSDDSHVFKGLRGQQLSSRHADRVFQHFDANKDGVLDTKELRHLLSCLATSGCVRQEHLNKVHSYLDDDQDGVVSSADFAERGLPWLNAVFNANAALVIVDVQNDFISGSLALKDCEAGHDGEKVVPVINRALDSFASLFKIVVYSFDWHPKDHISFIENLQCRTIASHSPIKHAATAQVGDTVILHTRAYGPVEQRLWPLHCVQNTRGAELHPKLKVVPNHTKIYKGTESDIDSYSAFWDNGKMKNTELFTTLCSHRVRDVIVCGLATDVCVGSTALHAQEHGFRTALLEDASRGISNSAIARVKSQLLAGNGLVAVTSQLGSLLERRERPLEWVLAAIDSAVKLRYT